MRHADANGGARGERPMSFLDDDRPRKAPKPEPGEPLADLSIDELKARIGTYQDEIARLTREIEAKEKHRVAADSFFRK
jgi:uncharacterized small protein (DUF1192 family)